MKDPNEGENIVFKGPRVDWYRPASLSALLRLKTQHPAGKLVVGNTETGEYMIFSLKSSM